MGRYSRPLAGQPDRLARVRPGERALDVGCGPGAWTEHLVERLGAERVSAIDPSAPFVEACRERFPGVDVRQGIAEALPYADDRFDVAGACLVVHFMADPVAGIAEMARVTRPGAGSARRSGTSPGAASRWRRSGRRSPRSTPEHPGERGRPGRSAGQLERVLRWPAGLRRRRGHRARGHRHAPDASRSGGSPTSTRSGPVGEVIAALDPDTGERLRAACPRPPGSRPF